MELFLELLLQLLGELLLQLALEICFELGLQSIAAPFRRKSNPLFAAIGYALFGSIAGALSLAAFPTLFIVSHPGRLTNLALTPILAGCAMVAIGSWRRSRDQELVRLDRFAYGYLFALAMAPVRFSFGH